MDSPADQADNLSMASEKIRALECVNTAMLTPKQRDAIRRLRKRTDKMIVDLINFYRKNEIDEPSYNEVDKYR